MVECVTPMDVLGGLFISCLLKNEVKEEVEKKKSASEAQKGELGSVFVAHAKHADISLWCSNSSHEKHLLTQRPCIKSAARTEIGGLTAVCQICL